MQHDREKFSMQDVAEITIGSVVLAFPVALSEEVWNLSEELSLGRTLLISLSSILFIGWYVINYFIERILNLIGVNFYCEYFLFI